MSYTENFDIEIAIEETKYFLEQQFLGVESIKSSARETLSSASVIIALVGSLQIISGGFNIDDMGLKEIIMIIVLALYVILLFVSTTTLLPIYVSTPMKVSFSTFEKIFFNKEPKRILENRLRNYLEATKKNEPTINKLKNKATVVNSIFLAIIMSLLALVLLAYV